MRKHSRMATFHLTIRYINTEREYWGYIAADLPDGEWSERDEIFETFEDAFNWIASIVRNAHDVDWSFSSDSEGTSWEATIERSLEWLLLGQLLDGAAE